MFDNNNNNNNNIDISLFSFATADCFFDEKDRDSEEKEERFFILPRKRAHSSTNKQTQKTRECVSLRFSRDSSTHTIVVRRENKEVGSSSTHSRANAAVYFLFRERLIARTNARKTRFLLSHKRRIELNGLLFARGSCIIIVISAFFFFRRRA